MKRMMAALVIFAGLWAGYWWVGISSLRAGITQGLAQSAGRITLADWRAQGFPSRFDVTITGADLRGSNLRGAGWRWRIPQAQVMALAWAPTKLIVWAGVPQVLTLNGQDFPIDAKDMRANIDFGASTDLPLQKIVAVLEAPRLGGVRADQARLALQQIDTGPRYRIGAAVTALIVPAGGADLALDAEVTLPEVIDRGSLNSGIARPQAIDLKSLTLSIGGAKLSASGALTVTKTGHLDGPMQVEIDNPDALIAAIRGAQMVPEDQVRALENVLRAIRGKDGHTTVPVTFARGQTILGGLFPIGPAPQFP